MKKKPTSVKKTTQHKKAASSWKKETRLIVPEFAVVVPDFDSPLVVSCVDWEERIKARSSLMPVGLLDQLDQNHAQAGLDVYNELCLPDVVGTPKFGAVGGEWFAEIVRAVFGSWNGARRAINEFFFLVPKKSSKTTNSAAIMVTAMLCAERPRSEFLLVAPTHAIAKLAFDQAVGMIEAEHALSTMCQIQEYIKKITVRNTKCSLQIKSFDTKVMTGTKPCGVLLDELHVISDMTDADRVIGQVRGGIISQAEGFLIMITTQSERPPKGVFRTELLKARKIRDGEVSGVRCLPILYEFPDSIAKNKIRPNEWRNSAHWDMVTPNNGKSITIERLIEEFAKAKLAGEEEVIRWASQHLNVEVGMSLRSDNWSAGKYWPAAARTMTLDELLERSEIVTIGADGGGLDDLLGFAVLGREKETGNWLLWNHAWVHESAIERHNEAEALWRDFEKEGDLTIVATMGDDMDELCEIAGRIVASNKLDKAGVDPSGIGQIVDTLVEAGVHNDEKNNQIVSISQGWRLTAAIKTMERKLVEKKLFHANQSLMSWSVGCAKVEPRGNAVLITKQASGNAKIDPLMASLNAVELMSLNPKSAEAKFQMFVVGG